MLKRVMILTVASIAFVGYLESPAHSAAHEEALLKPNSVCTASQQQLLYLAERMQHYAVDIAGHAGGRKADRAVLAIMDLIEDIDRSLPQNCR